MEKDSVIEVEHISKSFNLGRIGLSSSKFGRLMGKSKVEQHIALQDISFHLKKGEILGVIGHNGAGKSTLLKILSQITPPDSGKITIKGKLTSLLEVGTGFHPELTGRENIFMNGAILGMSHTEIKAKLEQIITFAGIKKFIDTPVKRYSSGMYVRLAFAVAAHLDSDILVIDEVLAVGDAAFQKKCLGKMSDLTGEGKTVIFVSHNMSAVRNLCSRVVLLENGETTFNGNTLEGVKKYLSSSHNQGLRYEYTPQKEKEKSSGQLEITHAQLLTDQKKPETSPFDVFTPLSVQLKVRCKEALLNHGIQLNIKNEGEIICGSFDVSNKKNEHLLTQRKAGEYTVTVNFPTPLLKAGDYTIDLHVSKFGYGSIQVLENALSFEIDVLTKDPKYQFYAKNRPGYCAFEPSWNYE